MAFVSALFIFTMSLTAMFTFVLIMTWRKRLQGTAGAADAARSIGKKHERKIITIHSMILATFIVVSLLSFMDTQRTFYYFAIEAALFASGTFVALLGGAGSVKKYILPLTICIIFAANSATVTFVNGMIPLGPDQYRDQQAANLIVTSTTIDDAQTLVDRSSDYYVLFPALPIGLSMLSIVTDSQPHLNYPLLAPAAGFAFVLGAFVAVRRVTGDELAGWIAAFILLSTPRLIHLSPIPNHISLTMIAVAFFLIMIRLTKRKLEKSDRMYFGIVLFLLLGSIIYHPTGGLALLFMLLAIVAITMSVRPTLSHKFRLISLIAGIVSIMYWFYNELTLSAISNIGVTFFETFSGKLPSGTYSPNTFAEGNDMFAFAWAMPYAISLAFLLVYAIYSRRRGSGILVADKSIVALCAALVAVPLTIFGFISFFLAPGAAIERYLSSITFFLMLFPAAIVAGLILRRMKLQYFAPVLGVLVASVAIGLYSPSMAPLEHQEQETKVPLLGAHIEVSPLERHLPQGTYAYTDNDLPSFQSLKPGIRTIESTGAYEDARETLRVFLDGTLESHTIGGEKTIFVIKSDRLPTEKLYPGMNLISSSGNHMTFLLERDEPPT